MGWYRLHGCSMARWGALVVSAGLVLALAPPPATAESAEPASPAVAAPGSLTAEQAGRDARILQRALTELHPGLTKYRSQAEMDAAFAQFEERARAARSATETYLAATELAAAIRCGHTWTNPLNQAEPLQSMLAKPANKLPLNLALVQGRWLVTASVDAAVLSGDELLAIDGVPGPLIVERMGPYLRADGASDGKRLIQLSHEAETSMMDWVWPLLQPPKDGRYQFHLRRASGERDTVNVAAVTLADRRDKLVRAGWKPPTDDWAFEIRDNAAILTLPTFAFWNGEFDWRASLDRTFAEIISRKIPNLVIDIRRNEGGADIGEAILARLIKKALRDPTSQRIVSFERVPYSLARYLDTWDFSFFDRTGRVEKLGPHRYRDKSMGTSPNTVQPRGPRYTGRVFVLIGPENSSATFQFAQQLKRSGAATLVGETTGGNQRGLNGGELAWVTLPNSGASVDIPLISMGPVASQPDAGIAPDVWAGATFEDRRAGRDVGMGTVMASIGRGGR